MKHSVPRAWGRKEGKAYRLSTDEFSSQIERPL
jgi:hypothetical protein